MTVSEHVDSQPSGLLTREENQAMLSQHFAAKTNIKIKIVNSQPDVCLFVCLFDLQVLTMFGGIAKVPFEQAVVVLARD